MGILKKMGSFGLDKIKHKEKDKKDPKKRFNVKLKLHLKSAGLDPDPRKMDKFIFKLSIYTVILFTILLVSISSYVYHFSISFIFTLTILLWTLGFIIILFTCWLIFHLIIDLKIFYRRVAVEEVLPDFLQLTSSNIKSGMNIDKALWFAVRPRFGILAKEIEKVAKQTMSGEDLIEALNDFSERYDSKILKRSISLLIEGIKAGGEIGDLLNKISSNIQETRILKKEMSASLTTYVVFISFATVLAAPLLFALSNQIIEVIQTLSSTISVPSTSGFGISFSGTSVSIQDFRIFSVVSLAITSFFSAVIVATIKKGSAKDGLKYIPIFIISSIVVFLVVSFALKGFISGFF